MVAEGLRRRLAPKARAEGALDFLAFLDVSVKHFPRKSSLPRRARFGALPRRHVGPVNKFLLTVVLFPDLYCC
jgi:hypothetical protein|tara:strand:+ start:246 stop:464 length:219 start_codon:yes stop_codon:yes gene_type:complete